MIEIINEKILKNWERKLVHQAITDASKFITNKYGVSFFDYNVGIRCSRTCRFSYYSIDEKLIRLQLNRNKWYTYKRKKNKVYANDIEVGYSLSYTLDLIHELTHFIQDIQKRKYSEVETTQNEIDYIQQFHSHLIKKLKPIE